ncbi:hypothetical protein TRVL_00318 [Trypanosoma vivax]|nr:hypothetical protein TRVL_00318 [Trypanosoma vivax]
MSSVSRNRKRLLRYASEGGTSSAYLKRRRIEDIAPALKERQPSSACLKEGNSRTASSSVLSAELLDFIRQHCPNVPSKYRHGELRVVQYLSAVKVENEPSKEGDLSVIVKRLEVADRGKAFALLGLAALQRRLSHRDACSHETSILVLVEDSAEAEALSSSLRETFNLTRVVVVDGPHPVTYPVASGSSAKDCDASDGITFLTGTTVFVCSLQTFISVDVCGAVWNSVGAFAILLTASGGIQRIMPKKERSESAGLLNELSKRRWNLLGHVRTAIVLAFSSSMLYAPVADALTTTTMLSEKGVKDGPGDSCSTAQDATEPVAVKRDPVSANYVVIEGTHRFHMLYSLLMNLRVGQGAVVHVSTKELCLFLCDVLYALGELPASLLLLADYEGPSTYTSVRDCEEDRQRICAEFDQLMMQCSHGADSNSKGKDRVVLFSAFGLVPLHGTIFVQYDTIVDIANFSQFISDVLTPSLYRVAPLKQLSSGDSATSGKGQKRALPKSGGNKATDGTVLPTNAQYRYILILLRRNEVRTVVPLLKRSGKRLCISFQPMKQPPSTTRYLLSVKKICALHKKQFAIQNEAYAAYRATMLLYSLINPKKDIYDECCVDLSLVAQELGYAEAPIVDLRTRDTAFRKKEDIFRAAKLRAVTERRRLLEYAKTNIIGEGPEPYPEEVDRNDDADGDGGVQQC